MSTHRPFSDVASFVMTVDVTSWTCITLRRAVIVCVVGRFTSATSVSYKEFFLGIVEYISSALELVAQPSRSSLETWFCTEATF